MKKFYVTLILTISLIFTFAQQKQNSKPVISDEPIKIIGQKISPMPGGHTIYDNQTNNSMAKKLVAYPDGTVGMTWIMGLDPDNSWPNRGAGYNFFDGSEWGPVPTETIHTDRCGGASYAALGVNGEINMSYFPVEFPDYDMVVSRRTEKGVGDWDEYLLSGPDDVAIVWPTVVTNGPDNNYIHLLAQTYGTEYNNQPNALLYYRSLDGGETWDIEHQLFDELGPDNFTAIYRDQYAWAEPKGETIAFSCGFEKEAGFIFKSEDNGETWEATQVYENPFSPYPLIETPNFGAGDGTQACAIDADGNVHVVFGRMVHNYDAAGAAYYFPLTEGIIYWKEGMEMLDTTSVSSYTTDLLEENGNLIGNVIYNGFDLMDDMLSYNGKSMTSWPQINIDGNNNIFVIWSAIAPGYDNGAYNYRHVSGITSTDGGNTWSDIEDYTDDLIFIFSECVYPVMAGNFVNGIANIVFQEDNEPGIAEWLANHDYSDNYMTHLQIELGFSVGIEVEETPNITISEVFPNPMRGIASVELKLHKEMHVSYSITNITGQLVLRNDLGNLQTGRRLIEIESSSLKKGIYYLSINFDGANQTQKIIVQ